MRKYTGKSRMCLGKKMGTSRSPRHQLRVQQGCCLPFISRIYSRRSYMGRWSLPISLRRLFVPLPLCASNKHSDQENRLSPARNEIGWYYARGCNYTLNTPRARIPSVDLSLSRSILRASNGSRECDKWQKTGRDRGPSNKIADQ